MEVIVGTSHAKRFVQILSDGSTDEDAPTYDAPEMSYVTGSWIPGGSIRQVTDLAEQILTSHRHEREKWPAIVYMVCSMPDTTTKVVEHYGP